MSETRDARRAQAPRPPPTPPRPPTMRPANPTVPHGVSPRTPAVSGASANVQRAPVAGRAGSMRSTQPGVGETELPAARPPSARPPSDSERGASAADGSAADGSADDVEGRTPIADAAVTPVWPARKVPAVADPEETAPQPALSMTSAMREEIWAIVRAAVQEGVAPVVAKQRELEARVEHERVERARVERERPPAQLAVAAAPVLASIPVTADSSIPPAPLAIPAPRPPRLDGSGAPNAPRIDATPTAPRVMAKPGVSARPPGGSIPPTGFGVVVADGPKAALDLPSAGGGPIDIPDFGRRRRVVGRVIVALMLLGVIAAVVVTVLSHT